MLSWAKNEILWFSLTGSRIYTTITKKISQSCSLSECRSEYIKLGGQFWVLEISELIGFRTFQISSVSLINVFEIIFGKMNDVKIHIISLDLCFYYFHWRKGSISHLKLVRVILLILTLINKEFYYFSVFYTMLVTFTSISKDYHLGTPNL